MDVIESPRATSCLDTVVAQPTNRIDDSRVDEIETSAVVPNGAAGLDVVEGDEQVTVQGVVSSHVQSVESYEPDVVGLGLLKLHHTVN